VRAFKKGDLVRSGFGEKVLRAEKGLGIVIGHHSSSGSYQVRWAGDYGTFWATDFQLELVSEGQ
jgi:hypothetical protein